MGIFYDPTKPAANDKPANDQPIMQQNFASLKTLIDVDHVDFDSKYYGEHNQVTFGSDNVPSLPTPNDASGNAQGILFTNTTSGSSKVNQLFYYAGTASQSANQYVISGTGSVMLFGGIIIKWGVVTVTTNPQTISFSPAFPNNCFSVVVTPTSGLTSYSCVVVDNTSFKIMNSFRPLNYNYLAIGN